jgi:hypothetical protein
MILFRALKPRNLPTTYPTIQDFHTSQLEPKFVDNKVQVSEQLILEKWVSLEQQSELRLLANKYLHLPTMVSHLFHGD